MNIDNLATEILREEKKRTAFWAGAFIVLSLISAIGSIKKGMTV